MGMQLTEVILRHSRQLHLGECAGFGESLCVVALGLSIYVKGRAKWITALCCNSIQDMGD